MTYCKEENLKNICRYLPAKLSSVLEKLGAERIDKLCEIRIRADKPVALHFTSESNFITLSGRLTSFFSNDLLRLTAEETETIFNSMCRYSVHSFSDDIANGFITVEGGSRVGVYGRAVTDGTQIISVKSVRGMNIRISGEFIGIAQPLSFLADGAKHPNILICGPPASGKTTVLRDFCRILSDEKGFKVCLVDERCEADGCNTGINTDVLSGYPKAAGVQAAVRTLSPEYIAFDEIGSANEVGAVCEGLNSGVSFVMTVHCADRYELARKPQLRVLQSCGAVDWIVFLKNKGEISEIFPAKEVSNENCGADSFGRVLRTDRSVHSVQNEYAGANA